MSMPSLLSDYRRYERVEKDPTKKYIDLSNIPFVAPASLLPSYYFAKANSITRYKPHPNTREHLAKIFGHSQGNKNLLPLIPINLKVKDERAKIRVLSSINKKIRNLLFPDDDEGYLEYGDEGFKYIIDEILSNIDQHSKANKIYVYCQSYPFQGYVDVGILDDGVTIPGKYEESRLEFEDKEVNPYIFNNDCEAIYKSLNGISTKREFKNEVEGLESEKDIPKVDTIGHGINTSVRAITEVLSGSMLIASRKGVCHVTPNDKKFIKPKDNNNINGTLMCIRFKKGEFNLKQYRECILEHRIITDVNI